MYVHNIKTDDETNIQDNSVLNGPANIFPLHIGKRVTVADGAMFHGCTINDQTLIGMGAIVLDNPKVGEKAVIAAVSLLVESKKFPDSTLNTGSPAQVKKSFTKLNRPEAVSNIAW